jgi:hypothetical protein
VPAAPEGLDQIDQPEQVIGAKSASPGSRHLECGWLGDARPPDGHVAKPPPCVLEVDPVLAPRLLACHELELATGQRVEAMGHADAMSLPILRI